ncbi:septal ring lytic transglycosylase RlpA family protein [Sediminibacterium sp.]|uniref:septal ring lytic transglycosylase RlpA family protein n=1 Tax=Sediminibacterium sp. TaxID=1917865 RepID=UPI00273638A3|nr:septal ring lytic transglycosylase RlpA family protein [Sediminibacterium sp.]MDP3392812.1 septal ring lytic transglycosylase RlpA family protein [Sediminibacterium sp.]MDP3565934.1 septal ring lytic transglycosylase RlpA family protein [Sediminibacterium sp.]
MHIRILFILMLFIVGKVQGQTQTDSVMFNPGMPDSLLWSLDSALKADANLVFTGKVVLGTASYYSGRFEGIKTASGERFSNKAFTGASNNLKLGTWVKVTNVNNGKWVVVKINDKMHPRMKKKGRVIDLTRAAAQKLQFLNKGLAKVKLEVIETPEGKNN